MTAREKLDNNQIAVYAVTLVAAAAIGLMRPDFGQSVEQFISVILGVLMFGMFAQIPFFRLKEAMNNRKFIYALLVVNYIAVPLAVWGLCRLLPQDSALLPGVLLVLLTPCIDYVIVFTHLGKGNEKLILVSTPLLFVTQILLLPLYLWLFLGPQAAEMVSVGPFLEAFLVLIVLPLLLALLAQRWGRVRKAGERFVAGTAWLPVPFMALTLFAVVASQIADLYASFDQIIRVVPVYAGYLILVPLMAKLVARLFRLDAGAGRALIFSASTRNSLVVLPLAMALPEPLRDIATAAVVTQTILELVGELIYIRYVPNVLWRDK